MLASDPHSASCEGQPGSCLTRPAPGIPSDDGVTSISGAGATVVGVGPEGSATTPADAVRRALSWTERAGTGAGRPVAKAGVAPTSPTMTSAPITARRPSIRID